MTGWTKRKDLPERLSAGLKEVDETISIVAEVTDPEWTRK